MQFQRFVKKLTELLTISIKDSSRFREEVMELSGGQRVLNCIQCGACSTTCVVARFNPLFDPQRVMKMVLLGLEEVLSEDLPWHCSGCFLCSERCPEDADPAGVILSLKRLTLLKGTNGGVGVKHVKAITKQIKRHGHLVEILLPFQTKGYFSPLLALSYIPMGLSLLRRKKVLLPAFLPHRHPALREIFTRFGGSRK